MNKTMRHNYVRPQSERIRVAAMHTLLAGSGEGRLQFGSGKADNTRPILAPRNDWYEEDDE